MLQKQMTSESIREKVEQEIAGEWSLTNAHGCDLQRCLVSPEMREYEDCGSGRPLADPLPSIKLWLVLEEIPGDCSGYKVVFGEDSGMFGLATSNIAGGDVFLGFYGTFREAFSAM